jgi:hypothetical protein
MAAGPSYRPVDPRPSFPELEQQVLERWRERDVFASRSRRREGAQPWVFYEGPPTANGRPGCTTSSRASSRTSSPLQARCAATPSSARAAGTATACPSRSPSSRSSGSRARADSSATDRRVQPQCRESVFEFLEDWDALTERIGFWVDLDEAYRTLDTSYVESLWWALKSIWDKGLLYEGHKVVPYCPRCGTALSSHEVALGYRDVVDPSVYVRFPVARAADRWSPATSCSSGPRRRGRSSPTPPWRVDPKLTYVRRTRERGRARCSCSPRRSSTRARRGHGDPRAVPGAGPRGPLLRAAVPVPGRAGVRRRGHTGAARGLRHRRGRHRLVHTAIAFGEDDFRSASSTASASSTPSGSTGPTTSASALLPASSSRTPIPTSSPICGSAGSSSARSLRARLPALLALRHAAPLLRQALLVHRHESAARPPARGQRVGLLASRAHQHGRFGSGCEATSTGRCRASATGARRSGVAVRGETSITSTASARSPSCASARGSSSRTRTGPSSTTSPSPARTSEGHDAPRPRGHRRVVRLGGDALSPASRAVRERGALRGALPADFICEALDQTRGWFTPCSRSPP